MTARANTIEIAGLTKVYGSGDTAVAALRGVDLVLRRGEYVAVMGPSGSGKSTLMNLLGCLDTPTAGSYRLDGVETGTLDETGLALVRSRKIGFIFQSFNLVPRMSALANVELPLAYAKVPRRLRRQRALAALDMVGLSDRARFRPNQLSGGQQQRVAIARALVTSPSLLLADEPTGNLDSRSTESILELLATLHRHGRTIVVITHEHEVGAHAERTVVVRDGQIVSSQYRSPQPLAGALA